MSMELTRLNIEQIEHVALRGANSGQFGYAKPEQAFIAVLAGQEVGIGPFAAMNGIHIIKGKPVVGSNLLARLVKSSGKYDYRVVKHDHTECVIAFFEGGDHVGDSRFTMEMAQRAGLASNENWKKVPENMLFARAMSNGVKWYTPDVTAGPFYVEGEVEESLPTPPPRDVVAVVEAEQAPPARTPSAEPAAPPSFPDDLADVQNAKPEKKKQTAIAKRDAVDAKADAETEAMFGEAFEANKPSAAYSSDAAS